ncbi:uncharacterized protein LOC116268300 [Nymphaea colorata]|nr:uncharacterized protein LOC116268300 [Nymphaea colorata]
MAGVNVFSAFVISLITNLVATGLFVKLLVLDRGSALEFFLIYNIFSFERILENLQVVIAEFINSLKYLKSTERLMNVPHERGEVRETQWVEEGRIQFEGFSVKYSDELETVLSGIDVRVAKGEKIGVVGRTGSGKSTTLLSLLRILEAHSGRILVDGTDISALDLQSLRAGFNVILQDSFLFTGTYEDQSIIRALELCGLWEAVRARNGLATVIEEGGDNFSAGEKQLINISRTLLNPKRIVLIDEATASIDSRADRLVQRVISEQLSASTIITIAHRIDTILSSDRIIVLDKGKIVELDAPMNSSRTPIPISANSTKNHIRAKGNLRKPQKSPKLCSVDSSYQS